MKQAAKLVIIDNDNQYLLMYRNAHPIFGDDPDLPGGTLEEGESLLETMVREVYEEAGIVIDGNRVTQLYDGMEYSIHDTRYSLYITRLDTRPEVIMSWEHKSYEWLGYDVFLKNIKRANDTYMHMVYDVLSKKV